MVPTAFEPVATASTVVPTVFAWVATASAVVPVVLAWVATAYAVVPTVDELKMELFDREEAIRSKEREGVEQELWGNLLAYNLVRLEMARVAKIVKVEPEGPGSLVTVWTGSLGYRSRLY